MYGRDRFRYTKTLLVLKQYWEYCCKIKTQSKIELGRDLTVNGPYIRSKCKSESKKYEKGGPEKAIKQNDTLVHLDISFCEID